LPSPCPRGGFRDLFPVHDSVVLISTFTLSDIPHDFCDALVFHQKGFLILHDSGFDRRCDCVSLNEAVQDDGSEASGSSDVEGKFGVIFRALSEVPNGGFDTDFQRARVKPVSMGTVVLD
jgi:hypothetical protein